MASRFNFRTYIKKLNKVYDVYCLDYSTGKLRIKCCDKNGEIIINNIENETSNEFFDEEEFVLMQSTIFVDKNGKKIYENDILTDGSDKYLVRFEEDKNQLIMRCILCGKILLTDYESLNKKYMRYYMQYFEVIGNIYENLEIIGKNEKLIFKDKEQQEIDSIGDINYQKDKPMPISY